MIKGEVKPNCIYDARNFSFLEKIYLQNFFLEGDHQLNSNDVNLLAILGSVSFQDGKIFINEEKENKYSK